MIARTETHSDRERILALLSPRSTDACVRQVFADIDEINRLRPDVVFWPVYTDYSAGEWNTSIKQEYATQAGKLHCEVLYVNSLCKDKLTEPLAKGGAALFRNGAIEKEIPSGKEDTLVVEV